MTRFSGLPFVEKVISPDDPAMRAELLLLSSSFLIPNLAHQGLRIWDTLAIGEYLNEIKPEAKLLPTDLERRTRCRSISGEMHSGFGPMRAALPMNLKGDFPNFKVWARAQADIDRITEIWREHLGALWRPLSDGGGALAGGCDVRAGGDAPAYLSRQDRPKQRGLLPGDHGLARAARMDRGGEEPSRTTWRSSRSSSERRRGIPVFASRRDFASILGAEV